MCQSKYKNKEIQDALVLTELWNTPLNPSMALQKTILAFKKKKKV
jgi:hypothetical protein